METAEKEKVDFKFKEGDTKLSTHFYTLNPKIMEKVISEFKVLNKISYTKWGNTVFEGINKKGEECTYEMPCAYVMEEILGVNIFNF